MWPTVVLIVLVVAAAVAGWVFAVPRIRAARRRARVAGAVETFAEQRLALEQAFFRCASATGKPRGLRWKECQFEPGVTFVQDRQSGDLAALVAVTISFEAIEGGPMEEVEAVGNLRAATAMFTFANDGWLTEGRAFLNLDPEDAIGRFDGQVEVVPN